MRQFALIICFYIIFPLCIQAEVKDNFHERTLEDITVKRERVFTGTGLYGFMNGGADLFLEYGVRKLTTRDLVYSDEEYTLDIYEMPTPQDAYGIYSVHIFRCTHADTDNGINCLSAYQLQTVVSNFYVSLVFTSGSEKAKTNAKEVLQHYIADIKGDDVSFPEQLQTDISHPFSGVVKFLRGPISISGAQLLLATTLQGINTNGVWFFPSNKEGENTAIILFDDIESTTSVRKKIEPDDIIASGETWLHIRCRDTKKPTEDYGPFGF